MIFNQFLFFSLLGSILLDQCTCNTDDCRHAEGHGEDRFYLRIVLYYLNKRKSSRSISSNEFHGLRDNNSNSYGANRLLNLLDTALSIGEKESMN